MLSVSQIFVAAFLFTSGQLLRSVHGQFGSNFITVFEVQCNDGRCPRDVVQATADKAAGRVVADQCCVYFRDGCCTQEENNQLTTLFQLTLGLCIGIPLTTVVVIALVVVLAVYCKLHYSRLTQRGGLKEKPPVFQSTSTTSSIDYWRSSGDETKPTSKALFHFH